MDFRSALSALSAVALLAAGCAPAAAPPTSLSGLERIDAFAPQAQPPGVGPTPLVDLGIGRRTDVAIHVVATIQGESEPDFIDDFSERYRVTETVVLDGVDYQFQEGSSLSGDGPAPFSSYLRQDRSGLFLWQEDAGPLVRRYALAADEPRARFDADGFARRLSARGLDERVVAAYVAAAQRLAERAALAAKPGGGPNEHEITLLRYPLHKNRSWEGRVGFNVWTVEGRETIETKDGPMEAWRLNIVVPGAFGPNDVYRTWWGAPGELKREAHLETTATDPNGVPVGVLLWDETLELLDYQASS